MNGLKHEGRRSVDLGTLSPHRWTLESWGTKKINDIYTKIPESIRGPVFAGAPESPSPRILPGPFVGPASECRIDERHLSIGVFLGLDIVGTCPRLPRHGAQTGQKRLLPSKISHFHAI